MAFSLQHPVAYRPRINSHSPTRNMGYATNSNDNFSSAFIAQFLQHVDQTPGHGPNGDCWLWEEGRTKNGYGRYGSSYAHRIMYAIHYGGLPPASSGLEVRHRCHVRRCVNPHHILLGNRKQNVNDSIKAGRHVHGSRSPMAKLSDELVLECRGRYWYESASITELANDHGISVGVMHAAVTNRTWNHLPMPPQEVMEAREAPDNSLRGEDAPWARVGEEDVLRMRKAYWYLAVPLRELAEQYDIGTLTVHDIVHGVNWSHLPMPPEDVQRARERRTERGERHPKAKLTDEQVRAIRAEREKGSTYAAIALKYATSPSNVRSICTGMTRTDI